MESKEIITVPMTDAIIPSGVVDQPSVCGTFNFTTMKLIPLTQGLFTQVDDADYTELMQWKWSVSKYGKYFYAIRGIYLGNGKYKTILMHRQILDTPKEMQVDHIDHNGLNNRRYNIRNCTKHQNSMNQTGRGTSRYLGVHYARGKYIVAKIEINHKSIYLGLFKTEEDAARAYDNVAKKYFGEFANLNFRDNGND